MFEDKKQEVEKAYQNAMACGKQFNDALMELRDIELPHNYEEMDEEGKNNFIQLGREIDMRAAYLLRSLLVQHGNVIFL